MIRCHDRLLERAGSLKKAGTWDLSPSLYLGDCGTGPLLPSALLKSNWHLLSLPRCHSCSRPYPGPPSVSLNTAPFSPPHEIYRAHREANPPQTRIPNYVLRSYCRQGVSTSTHSQLRKGCIINIPRTAPDSGLISYKFSIMLCLTVCFITSSLGGTGKSITTLPYCTAKLI